MHSFLRQICNVNAHLKTRLAINFFVFSLFSIDCFAMKEQDQDYHCKILAMLASHLCFCQMTTSRKMSNTCTEIIYLFLRRLSFQNSDFVIIWLALLIIPNSASPAKYLEVQSQMDLQEQLTMIFVSMTNFIFYSVMIEFTSSPHLSKL